MSFKAHHSHTESIHSLVKCSVKEQSTLLIQILEIESRCNFRKKDGREGEGEGKKKINQKQTCKLKIAKKYCHAN